MIQYDVCYILTLIFILDIWYIIYRVKNLFCDILKTYELESTLYKTYMLQKMIRQSGIARILTKQYTELKIHIKYIKKILYSINFRKI